VTGAAEPRFGLLETIRAHALERLTASGELHAIRQRHASTMLDLAESAERHLVSPEQRRALDEVDLEFDNIRAALAWCCSDAGDVELGQRLVGSLAWFWYLHGHLQEGRRWVQRLLARGSDADTPGLARARFALGGITVMTGDAASAREPLEDGIARFRRQQDWRRLTNGLSLLGLTMAMLGEPAAALAHYAESMAFARQTQDAWLEAFLLTNQGAASDRLGEVGAAEKLYRSSLEQFGGLGDAWGSGIALRGLGALALARGDYAEAQARYRESVACFRQSGDVRGLPQALLGLGKATLRAGDGSRAEEVLREALSRWQHIGIEPGVVRSLGNLADVAAAQGHWERAARLYATTATQARRLGVDFTADDRAARDRNLACARARLPESAYAVAWSTGAAMDLEQASRMTAA
jgi:tetratricopeptide (TPR) repeat protein